MLLLQSNKVYKCLARYCIIMTFDHHVHVTGRPLGQYELDFVAEKLKDSLESNKISGFIGIVSEGTFYKPPKTTKDIILNFSSVFDNNKEGLNLVRKLGGEPAVLLYPEAIASDSNRLNFTFKKIKENGVKVLKLYPTDNSDISPIISGAKDFGITTLLVHTPSDFKIIEPVFDLATKNDLALILGHGCYESDELIKLVKEHGAYVDTAIHSVKNIKKWIEQGLEENLVFGSDWPASDKKPIIENGFINTDKLIDWNTHQRELDKLKEMGLSENIYNKKVVCD